MSKGQKGNTEAKKPKKAESKPASTSATVPVPAVAVPDRTRKK
jgi:hypothetical protein